MIKNEKLLLSLSIAFLTVEAILGVLLQAAQDVISLNLRYTAVVLACLFTFLFAEKSRSYLLTQVALVATVFADYFLVLRTDMRQLPAMLFFAAAHIAYFLRLFFEDGRKTHRYTRLIVHAALSLIASVVTLAVLGEACDALAIVSIFCYVNLILNIVFSCLTFKQNALLSIGLILFLLCDTVIGLIFIKAYLPIPPDSFLYTIILPSFDLAWAFYLPSQALLAISLLPKRLKTA